MFYRWNRILTITFSCFIATISAQTTLALDIGQNTVDVMYNGGTWSSMADDSALTNDVHISENSDRALDSEVQFSAERLCRGVLIAQGWILTAAHCVKDFYSAELTITRTSDQSSAKSGSLSLKVQDIIIHPDYQEANLEADIALLRISNSEEKIESDIKFGWKNVIQGDLSIDSGRTMEVYSGHISTADLYTTNGKNTGSKWQLLDFEQCQAAIQVAWQNRGMLTNEPLIESDQICLMASSAEYATCHGDSGSPVYLATDTGLYIAGLVSWNYQCNNSEFPTALVDLEIYKDWISSTINTLQVKSNINLGMVPVDKKFYTSIDIYNPDYMSTGIYLEFVGSPDSYIEIVGNSCGIGTSPLCKIDIQVTAYEGGELEESLYLSSTDGSIRQKVILNAKATRAIASSSIDEQAEIEWFSNSSYAWNIFDNQVEKVPATDSALSAQRLLGLIKTTTEKILKIDRLESCNSEVSCADVRILLNKKELKNNSQNSWTFKTLPNVTYALEFVNQNKVITPKQELVVSENANNSARFKINTKNTKKEIIAAAKEEGGAFAFLWLGCCLLLLKRKKPA